MSDRCFFISPNGDFWGHISRLLPYYFPKKVLIRYLWPSCTTTPL